MRRGRIVVYCCRGDEGLNRQLIFVTGYFGAPILETAREVSSRKAMPVLDLDSEIEKRDGRSIRRICMAAGEHGYRNREYELVQALVSDSDGAPRPDGSDRGLVIACGDGILHDDMSRDLILRHTLLIAGEELSADELWERAGKQSGTYHAFMLFGTEEEKKKAFLEHHARQEALFESVHHIL